MNKYLGKVILVKLPNVKSPRYRWIIRKHENGKYISRIPNDGVSIKELDLKRPTDYGKEVFLPIGSKPFIVSGSKKSRKKSFRNLKTKTKKIY